MSDDTKTHSALIRDLRIVQAAAAQTWAQKVAALRERLGHDPTLDELIEVARRHEMLPAEVEAQRESWIRAMRATGDPRLD